MNDEKQSGPERGMVALRPEARPAIYKVLDRQQKDAFGRIVKLIVEAIDGIDAARGSRSAETIGTSTQLPPWLDHRSATRMAFLHGHRGMGKTTVMLSVLRACLHWDDTEYPPELGSAIRKMRARTVWLEPIALEPLPGSANLLAALLARIDRAVQQRISASGEGAGDATGRGRGGALAFMPDQERALLQLQRLQTAVAVAWDGNLPARGGQLDPDTYAVELLRAEQSRLSLKHDLSVRLDALADAFYPAAAPVTNPLFILPVDDVDLDPLRCLEILKLLRLVPVPRLFAIVLGNLRIVDLVLNLQYSNEFASAYQGRFLDTLSVDSNEVAGWAGQAAANAVAKLIPLAQRITLEHMSVHESLNFTPLSAAAQRPPRFHQLLARIPLKFEAKYTARHHLKDLREFLLGARDYEDEVKEKDVEKAHCSAKTILRAPPRRIADWWFDLQRLLDRVDGIIKSSTTLDPQIAAKKVHKEIVLALGRICYWAINEDHLLPTPIRSIYRRALRINPADVWELVEPVDSIPDIDSAYVLSRLRSGVEEHPWNNIQPSPIVFINHGKGWYLRPAKERILSPPVILDPEEKPDYAFASGISKPRFNEDSTYALMLLHDLLGLGPQAEVMKQSIQINRPYERWAATVWGGEGGWGWISWPAPIFGSYWEIDLVVSYWNRVVSVVEDCEQVAPKNSIEKTLEPLVFGWIDAAWAVWCGGEPCTLREPRDWIELAQKVAGLIAFARQERIKGVMDWLRRLAYFLSPAVSGVSLDVVNEFVAQDHLKAEWEVSAGLITADHQRIINFFVEKKMNTLVKQLGRAVNEHLGVLFANDKPSSSPSSARASRKGAYEERSKGTSGRPSSKNRGRG